MKRPENKCINCTLRRTRCRFGRGVVVWRNCPNFRPKKEAVGAVEQK